MHGGERCSTWQRGSNKPSFFLQNLDAEGPFTLWDIPWEVPWDIPWYSVSPSESLLDFLCKWRTFRGTYWVPWHIPWDVPSDIPLCKLALSVWFLPEKVAPVQLYRRYYTTNYLPSHLLFTLSVVTLVTLWPPSATSATGARLPSLRNNQLSTHCTELTTHGSDFCQCCRDAVADGRCRC
jgi:hypothetical protein